MSSYTLSVSPTVMNHGLDQADMPVWLADFVESNWSAESGHREYNAADAMAASGDCFVTIATRLDKLAQGLPQDSAEQIELEHIIQILLYLQQYWSLSASYKHRQ